MHHHLHLQALLKLHLCYLGNMDSVPEIVVDSRDSLVADQSSQSSKRQAEVWKFVDSEVVDGREKAICKYCKLCLSSQPEKGTNHLNRYIGFHCHAIPQEDSDRFLATLETKSINGDQVVFDPKVFRILIAKYFINAEIAFQKADDPNWKNLINYCQPSFRVVGHQGVCTNCFYCMKRRSYN